MTYLNFLIITFIVVFIIDYSKAIQGILHPIIKRILHISKSSTIKIPLLDCSLCVTFWGGIIYFSIIGQFTILNIGFACACAYLTKNILSAFYLLQDLLVYIENALVRIITPK